MENFKKAAKKIGKKNYGQAREESSVINCKKGEVWVEDF